MLKCDYAYSSRPGSETHPCTYHANAHVQAHVCDRFVEACCDTATTDLGFGSPNLDLYVRYHMRYHIFGSPEWFVATGVDTNGDAKIWYRTVMTGWLPKWWLVFSRAARWAHLCSPRHVSLQTSTKILGHTRFNSAAHQPRGDSLWYIKIESGTYLPLCNHVSIRYTQIYTNILITHL